MWNKMAMDYLVYRVLGRRVAAKLKKLQRSPAQFFADMLVNRGVDEPVVRAMRGMLSRFESASEHEAQASTCTTVPPAEAKGENSSSGAAALQLCPRVVRVEQVPGAAGPKKADGLLNGGWRLDRTEVVGYPKSAMRRLSRQASDLSVSLVDPDVRRYCNVIVPKAVRVKGYPLFGGVFDEQGECIPGSRVFRGVENRLIVGPLAGCSPVAAVTRRAQFVYGGVAFDHFGHFLLETLSRLWQVGLYAGSARICVQLLTPELPPAARRVYELAGLLERIHPIKRGERFQRLVVPDPAFVIRNRAHIAFKASCLVIADRALRGSPVTISEQPLYFSRTRLLGGPRGRRLVFGEQALEAIMERNGIRVVHPETLDLAEQIRLVNTHRTIVGTIGSAFHLLLFSRIANRVIGFTTDTPNSSYLLCDALNCTQATYVQGTTLPAPIETEGLLLGRLPVMLSIDDVVSVLKGMGLIVDGDFDRAAAHAHSHAYKKQFLQRALAEATHCKLTALAAQAADIIKREFADDAELNRQLARAETVWKVPPAPSPHG